MGVDSYFIARYAATHYYFEQNTALYNATIENFKILGQLNIIGKNCNVTDDNCAAIRDLEDKSIDIIYIDPARRGDNNSKLIDIKDYSPNLLEILNPLLKVTKHILVKISPMADISYTLKQLPITTRVDIVAVDNECKELLFYLNRDAKEITNPIINCININSHNMRESLFSFTAEQERNSNSIFSNQINGYIYDANRAIIKGGAFKLIGERYNLNKIATNTHLYHSNVLIEEFPGRIYRLLEVLDFNKSTLKRLHRDYPMASIISKNFILDTNSLKRETKIKDGNNYYIIATTLNNNKKILLITQPL